MHSTLTVREWLLRLLGFSRDNRRQAMERAQARAQLLAAIDDLRRGLRDKDH